MGGISYRLSGRWAFAEDAAYAVGPLRDPRPGYASQTLVPLSRYEVMVGLRYDQ